MFITVYSTTLNLSYPQARWTVLRPSILFPLRSILIPPSHVSLRLSSRSIPFRFPRQNPLCISILPYAYHWTFSITLLDFIILVICSKGCRPFDIMKQHADRIFKMLNCWAVLILQPPKTLTVPPESSSMFWIVRVSQLSVRPSPHHYSGKSRVNCIQAYIWIYIGDIFLPTLTHHAYNPQHL